MASSSSATASSLPFSSSQQRPKRYDVFISLRGEGTRYNFPSHLYAALRRKSIETFFIDDELDRGDVISEAVIKAIEDSFVSLIVFSENYASSKWCLDALTKIVECKRLEKQVVIPVFYKIDPSNVRKQLGSYEEAFARHEKVLKKNKDKVLKWKAALTQVANLAGYDSRNFRTEYELVEEIVKHVLMKLNYIYPRKLRDLVGVEQNCVLIESLLTKHPSKVQIIGIWGPEGIGKTTLARVLFTKLSFQYDGRCFLENVRRKSEKIGLNFLHNKLVSELLEEDTHILTPQVISSFVSGRLNRQRSFIVLDDVNNSEQLKYLIGDHSCLGSGSRVIVTSREKYVLRKETDVIYEVKALSYPDSLQLFCLNAFNKSNPEMQLEEQSMRIVHYAKGIPLTLRVLGSSLRSKSIKEWDDFISSFASSAASSPFPSPVRPKNYDVFISFRGEDTRTTFTCHLNPALRRRNVETYIDDRLDRGDVISDALMKAIKDSCASLIIFSENYAFSKWCLDELTKIMECNSLEGQIVIPVFYRIDPSHVRKQSGRYMEAFEQHEGDFMVDKEKVLKWGAALTDAANLAGYDSQNYGTDYDLIEDVVKGVLQKLKHTKPGELRNLVGVEQNCASIESLLRKHSSEVRIIGIWGIGGVGKTTLAAILFAKLAFQYEGRCFLGNVRRKSEEYDLSYLRSMLLPELFGEENPHISTPQAASSTVSSELKSKKVFIVLDDISTSEQLKYLVGERDWLGMGSRIIVTTRDNHAISRGVDEIYEVKKLNFKDSLQLFSLNAFSKTNLEMQYEELSVKAVLHVEGIPLALKILSAYLRSKSKTQWNNALKKLQENSKIQDVLRLSYDDLNDHDKNVFLGISCFLNGQDKNNVIKLLDCWGFNPKSGIRNLVDKALATISDDNIVQMHDSIEEMGREISHLESRSWNWEKVYHTLKYNKGADAVEGIILDASQCKDLYLASTAFSEMIQLKFLKFTNLYETKTSTVHLPYGLETLPNNLSYLHWSGYPLKSLPSTFCAEKLVELSMPDSHLEKLWDGVLNLPNLKEIMLNGSKQLLELPDLSTALNLKSMYLIGCTSLRYVHSSILSLPKLKRLHLNQCNTLKSLRRDASSNFSKYLPTIGSSSFQKLIPMPNQMRRLYLGSTGELPTTTSPLDMLDYITFRVTENFDKLDTILDNLWYIKELDLSGCTLYELPENIKKLIFLQYLELNGSRLARLPANMKHLSWLRFLGIRNCWLLNSLPELPPLIHLDARDCTSLENVFCSIKEPPLVRCQSVALYLFENCIGLGQPALNTIMADAHVRIKLAAHNLLEEGGSLADEEDADNEKISVCIPGNKFPNWFRHCSALPMFTIELPLPSKILGFAFCVILPASESHSKYNVGCECSFQADDGETVTLESRFLNDRLISVGESKLVSDHIYLWYDARGSSFVMDKSMYSGVNFKKFSFRFFTTAQYIKGTEMSPYEEKVMIISCGVQPIYAPIDLITEDIISCGVQPIYAPIDLITEDGMLILNPIDESQGKGFHELESLPK